MAKPSRTRQNIVFPGSAALRKTASLMLPFYRKIARNASYNRQWSAAVRKADLDKMLKLFRQTVPLKEPDLSANGIGYFLDVEFPLPLLQYTNGTSIQPGQAQFTFNATIHRTIATAIIPLYEAIVRNRAFAIALAAAIRRRNRRTIERLVRSKVRSPHLRSVTTITAGFAMGFRMPSIRHTYFNEFFRGL